MAPVYLQPLRWASIASVQVYYHLAYRIRGWGSLPRGGGPKLLIANHQHEIESGVLISDMTIRTRAWRWPIFTVSSRRMWEPGFFAVRIAWMSPLLRGLNFGWLFSAIGMQPIENELHVRPFVSIAYTIHQLHPNAPIDQVFAESARDRLPAGVRTVADLLGAKHFAAGRSRVKLTEVLEPYRREILDVTRAQIESDLTHFETLQRGGASIFLTPEGHYSGDGKMQRLRGALTRLAPLAEVWLTGISYDPFVGRRLSMLYRIAKAMPDVPLDLQLKAVRPVTVSALLGHWLHPRGLSPFIETEAQLAVERALLALPRTAFVDPELEQKPRMMVAHALDGLVRLGVARREGETLRLTDHRMHPQFPRTSDIIEYMYNFHIETLEGATAS